MPTDDTKRALDDLWRASRDGMVAIAWPAGLAPACPNDELPDLAGLRLATISRFAWRRYLTRRLRDELIAEGFREENLDHYAKNLIVENLDRDFESIKKDALKEEVARQRCLANKTPLTDKDDTTLLTPWARKETWSPHEAAHLVCGLIPEDVSFVDRHLERESPTSKGLCGNVFVNPHGRHVSTVLKQWEERWTSKTERPDRERPSEFIAWCKRRGIDTSWLSTMADAPGLPVTPPIADIAPPVQPTWHLKPRIERCDGLATPVHEALRAAHQAGKPRPTAKEVLAYFDGPNRPKGILRVQADGCDFLDPRGEEKAADLRKISKRIEGMTTRPRGR